MFIAGGWDADQIDVIPNYVYPDPGPGTGQGGYALFVGRLDPIKGLNTLLEAWNRDAIELPLRIVGSGPLQDKIEAAASHNPLIQYMGPVDNDTATDLMGEASLVLVPTTARESFGRVAVEAMAKGTPPVVADHGGLSEIAVGGETGLRFAPGDVDALTDKISRLQTHPEQLAQMRTAARDRYLDLYTGERALEMWIRLYLEVIRTQRSATSGD
jgi:glycosyltransferase involved in cell wall biosynthesis